MSKIDELLRIQSKNNLIKSNQLRQKLLDKKEKEKKPEEIPKGVLAGLNLFHHNLPANNQQSVSNSVPTKKS